MQRAAMEGESDKSWTFYNENKPTQIWEIIGSIALNKNWKNIFLSEYQLYQWRIMSLTQNRFSFTWKRVLTQVVPKPRGV